MARATLAEFSDAFFPGSVLQYLRSHCPQGLIIKPSSNILVGITQRIDSVADRAELRDALDQRLVQWLLQAGFLSVAIPNSYQSGVVSGKSTLGRWLEAVRPGALILSGGNDVGEYLQRDATERFLLSWAEVNQVPVLGICRGLQMMAVWAGVNLLRIKGHVRTRHVLSVSGPQDKWPDSVNSYHNWSLSSCPDRFEVAAQAEDGAIEAIRHIELPWEGWMWHPEREEPFSQQDIARLRRLFGEQ